MASAGMKSTNALAKRRFFLRPSSQNWNMFLASGSIMALASKCRPTAFVWLFVNKPKEATKPPLAGRALIAETVSAALCEAKHSGEYLQALVVLVDLAAVRQGGKRTDDPDRPC